MKTQNHTGVGRRTAITAIALAATGIADGGQRARPSASAARWR